MIRAKLDAEARVELWFSGSPCKRHGCLDICEARRDLRKLLRERAEAALTAIAIVEAYPNATGDKIASAIRAAVVGGRKK